MPKEIIDSGEPAPKFAPIILLYKSRPPMSFERSPTYRGLNYEEEFNAMKAMIQVFNESSSEATQRRWDVECRNQDVRSAKRS